MMIIIPLTLHYRKEIVKGCDPDISQPSSSNWYKTTATSSYWIQTGHKTQKLKQFPDDISADLPQMYLSASEETKSTSKKQTPD